MRADEVHARRHPSREPPHDRRLGAADVREKSPGPARLGAGAFRRGQMQKCEIRQHAIEADIGKRKVLGIALAELDLWKHSLRDAGHFPGEIHPDRNRTPLRRSRGDVSGTATNIEDAHAWRHFGRCQKWCNELPGGARPNRIVFLRYSLPAFVLKLGKCVHVLPFNALSRDWLSAQ